MKNKTEYTVTYDRTDGSTGFLSTDSSSGYPYFSDRPDYAHIQTDIFKAMRSMKSVVKSMKTYYGADKVLFDTVRVVRIDYVDVSTNEQDYQAQLAEQAQEKLNPDELSALAAVMTAKTWGSTS